jgi:hypothetical protein
MGHIYKLIGLLVLLAFEGNNYAQKIVSPPISVVDLEANIKNMQKMYLSQYTDNVRYIPLETNMDHLIEYIDYLDVTDKFILASDRRSCFLYDKGGHFIRSIGAKGRGPGEYAYINDISLSNERIYIRDLFDLYEYNLDGTFVKKYKNCYLANGENYLQDAIIINDSLLLGNLQNRNGRENNKAILVNRYGNIKNYYKNYNLFDLDAGVRMADGIQQSACINKFNNRTFYLDPMDDTLFCMDDRYKLVPEYVFKLGKYEEPQSERAKGAQGLGYTKFLHVLNVLQTENFLFIDCMFTKHFPARRLTPNKLNPIPQFNADIFLWYNMTNALGIYNKKTSKLVFSEPTSTDNYYFTTGLYNDIDGGPRFMPGRMVNDSIMLMILQFPRLRAHIVSDDFKNSKPKYSEKKQRLEALTDSLTKTEIDNPILMLVTFNK